MAKKKIIKENPAAEVRKLFEEGKLIIGADRVGKLLKQGKISKVFVTTNCKEDNKETIKSYAKISGIEFTQLVIDNEELGVACKKPFSISVVGVVKD